MVIDLTMLDNNAVLRLLNNRDALLIFIAEWLEAYNNFKTEFSRTFNSMDDIYKIFIMIILHLKNRGEDDTVVEVINLLKTNNFIYEGFIKDLNADLSGYLARMNINDYGRNEITGMPKTVMVNHVIALRQDPQ